MIKRHSFLSLFVLVISMYLKYVHTQKLNDSHFNINICLYYMKCTQCPKEVNLCDINFIKEYCIGQEDEENQENNYVRIIQCTKLEQIKQSFFMHYINLFLSIQREIFEFFKMRTFGEKCFIIFIIILLIIILKCLDYYRICSYGLNDSGHEFKSFEIKKAPYQDLSRLKYQDPSLYKKIFKKFKHMQKNLCSICLQLKSNSTLPCGHSFHLLCIQDWISESISCPVCRSPKVRPILTFLYKNQNPHDIL